MDFTELLNNFTKLPDTDRQELTRVVKAETGKTLWVPNFGPQTDAYFCKADILYYGGQAGGGKSDLGIGLAVTKHNRSLIMRRKYNDLSFLTDRTIQIIGNRKGFNGSAPPKFSLPGGGLIEYGAAHNVGDELDWMGRPHDLLYIDEATHFAENQIRTLMGWVRSVDPNQRVRVVLGSNPPLSDEGLWIFKMFAPWIDPGFASPAKPGELRWCCVDDENQDIWVDGPGEYLINNRMVRALSRTFIPAKLSDNPFQNTQEYRAQLDGLPAHLRAALRDGDHLLAYKDHEYQLIPTQWIKMSMDQWTAQRPDVPMCTIAADVTGMTNEFGGGKQDKFVIASRHDGWYDSLVVTEAADAKSGQEKAAKILKYRRDGAVIVLDMGGGYGDSTYEHLRNNGYEVVRYKGSEKSTRQTKKSSIPYANTRAASYFSFMEDLDPYQPGGSRIILPNDKFLMSDLCSIRYDKNNRDANIIKLETKVDLCKRLGRSTDYSDPVIMAWTAGGKIESNYHVWNAQRATGKRPKVIMRSGSKRHGGH